MPNWKSKSDTELWWSNQPGNRGRTYPGDDIAEKQYQRNRAAGENNASMLRNFFFGKSDARKQKVEDAVNARRDAGTSIPLEPYVKPAPKGFVPLDLSYDEAVKASKGPRVSLDDDTDTIAQGQTVKRGGIIKKHAKGGKISLSDCKVNTAEKNHKSKNW